LKLFTAFHYIFFFKSTEKKLKQAPNKIDFK
jgi:hypothetical protein